MLFVVLVGFAGLDWGTSCGNCTRSDQFRESHEQEVQGDKLQSIFQKEVWVGVAEHSFHDNTFDHVVFVYTVKVISVCALIYFLIA